MAEFEGAKALDAVKRTDALRHGGTGDVKYHHGAEGLFESTEGDVRMRLYPNPSHLEFVDPVVTGGTRAAQTEHSGPQIASRHEGRGAAAAARRRGVPRPGRRRRDAQPAVARAATQTGGTIHIIQDNQVGFTTDPQEGRSTPYAADMAKGFNVPIIHVNADDVGELHRGDPAGDGVPGQVRRDVVIDLIGYRRYGHNETDEPAYTQPEQAAQIKKHPPISELYAGRLIEEGVVDQPGGRGRRHRAARGAQRNPQVAAREDRGGRVRGPDDHRRHRRARPLEEPGGRDEGLREAPADPERGAGQLPRELHRPPQAPQAARAAGRDPRRRADRVRPRRGARLRVAADRGHPHPADRPGHRARHLLQPPPRPPRREDRPQVRADPEPLGSAGSVRDPQQPALGERDASASSTATRPPRRRA